MSFSPRKITYITACEQRRPSKIRSISWTNKENPFRIRSTLKGKNLLLGSKFLALIVDLGRRKAKMKMTELLPLSVLIDHKPYTGLMTTSAFLNFLTCYGIQRLLSNKPTTKKKKSKKRAYTKYFKCHL